MGYDCTTLGSFKSMVIVTCVLSGHTDAILSVAITSDGKWALTGSVDNLHDSGIFQMLLVALVSFQGIPVRYNSVALTADGKWALTGSADKTARLWELIPHMSFAEVQKIIGAHEETTRSK